MKKSKNILDVLKEERELRKNDKTINEKVVEYILDGILKSVKYYNIYGKTECIEDIPCMIYNFPLYDRKEVSDIIVEKLKKMKFSVTVLNIGRIYISWYTNE
jgi:hypothetical protein